MGQAGLLLLYTCLQMSHILVMRDVYITNHFCTTSKTFQPEEVLSCANYRIPSSFITWCPPGVTLFQSVDTTYKNVQVYSIKSENKLTTRGICHLFIEGIKLKHIKVFLKMIPSTLLVPLAFRGYLILSFRFANSKWITLWSGYI